MDGAGLRDMVIGLRWRSSFLVNLGHGDAAALAA
jgi:hypothetical protein